MEIQDRYLSAENSEQGDIIEFKDEGKYEEIKSQEGKVKRVINFLVNNGKYDLIYTPSNTALKELMKVWGRETKKWINKKFQVKIADTIVFGKPKKVIFPIPLN